MTNSEAAALTDTELASAFAEALALLTDPTATAEAMLQGVDPTGVALALAVERDRRRGVLRLQA